MVRPQLIATVVAEDLVEVLEDQFCFLHLVFCDPATVDALHVRKSIDDVTSAQAASRHVIVQDGDAFESVELLELRDLDEGVDVVVTEGKLLQFLKLLQPLHLHV